MSRILGMSRHSRPPTLLSTFNVKEKQKLEQELEDVNAPPMSSDDEDEEGGDEGEPSIAELKSKLSGVKEEPLLDSDDSEPDRGSIKRTNFPTSSTINARTNTARKARESGRKQSPAEDIEETSLSSKRRMATSKVGNDSAGHLVDKQGFTKASTSKLKYGTFKYGKGSQASRGSQVSLGSQNSQTRKGQEDSSDCKIVTKKQQEDDLVNSSPIKKSSTFKPAPRESLSPAKPESKKRKLTVPTDDLGTPEKQVKRTMILPSRENSCSSQDTKERSIGASQESTFSYRGVFKPPAGLKNRKTKKKKERPPTPEYKPAIFINPLDIDSDFDLEGVHAETMSSPVLSDVDQVSDTEFAENDQPLQDRTTKCPWCGDVVSEQALKEYSKGKRLNVQMQTRFCAKHKRETAMDTWRERGYPHIDWDRLEERLKDHQEYLSKIVDGKKSYYRNLLAEKIQTGQARSLKKEGDLNPGYYGPRGCKLMCDYLVEEFGESLKEKATEDRVIAGRGSAAFIQSVLVAELAVRLIIEDMDVSAGEAREIMEESKPLGELLHEEI